MPEAADPSTGPPPVDPRGQPGRSGDHLIRSGVVVTGIGIALTLVAMLPLVTELELPSTFWWLAMLTGVGLAMVVLGLARNGRRRARTQRAAGTPTG